MINNCSQCNISPIVDIDVKCRNEECEVFDEAHHVYEWQKLEPVVSLEV